MLRWSRRRRRPGPIDLALYTSSGVFYSLIGVQSASSVAASLQTLVGVQEIPLERCMVWLLSPVLCSGLGRPLRLLIPYEVQCGNKVRSCTYYCIVNVSVIVLYNVVYDFRVLEMHVDACVSIHSRFHVCVFYACHAYSVCA